VHKLVVSGDVTQLVDENVGIRGDSGHRAHNVVRDVVDLIIEHLQAKLKPSKMSDTSL
jgi:hypothetical protein